MKDPAHLLPADPDQTVVLIVEHEVMVVNIARVALEADGHFVLTAANGEEALQLSRKFASHIHVLVSDIVMAQMDGIELRERIIAERPGTKVLLMSGQVDSIIASCPVLRKPFHIDTLKERIRQLLGSSAPS
jgi:DNA-binding NtrC family response regulator